jgi:hypothetical protein
MRPEILRDQPQDVRPLALGMKGGDEGETAENEPEDHKHMMIKSAAAMQEPFSRPACFHPSSCP